MDFKSYGLDSAKLAEQRTVELKLGDKEIKHTFSMGQFLEQYISENLKNPLYAKIKKPFAYNTDSLIDYIICSRDYSEFRGSPTIRNPFFAEGPPIEKTKIGFFSPKKVMDPSRRFLLFKDEELKEMPLPAVFKSKWSANAAKLLPYSTAKDHPFIADKMYSTGRRIIFDSYHAEVALGFGSKQIWGKIEFEDCAKIFDKTNFALPIKYYDKNSQSLEAVSLETKVNFSSMKDTIRIIGPLKAGIPGTKEDFAEFESLLKSKDKNSVLAQPKQLFPADIITQDMANLKPTSLTDFLAMWQYAANEGLWQTLEFTNNTTHSFQKEQVMLARKY